VEEVATAGKLMMWYQSIGEERIAQLELLIGEMAEHGGE
jgi:hypothetical protein